MKTMLFAMIIAAAMTFSGMAADAGNAKGHKMGKLKHMVAFKFKEGTSAEDIKKVEKAFKELEKKIDVIRSFDWGLNNSPEGFNKGCTHGFLLTFDNDKDRDTYLHHPDHKAFGSLVGPMLADVFVVDFNSTN